jgi:hypothetical protein
MTRQHLLAADPTCVIIVSASCPDREVVSGYLRSYLRWRRSSRAAELARMLIEAAYD